MNHITHAHYWLLILGGCCLITIYSFTAPSGLTWQHSGTDGGELALAVYSLGVAHPPGYPLYVLTGWLWGNLTPFGSPAGRLQMLSHISGVLGVFFTGTVIYQLCDQKYRLYLACALAASLALSFTYWSQAIIIEVYAFSMVFFTGLLGLSFTQKPDTHRWTLALITGVVLGLAIGHHLSAVLWLPGFAVLWGRKQWHWRFVGMGLGVSTLPILVWLLSGNQAYANWGRAHDSSHNLWQQITANSYQSYLQTPSISLFLEGLRTWLEITWHDFSLLAPVALLSMILLARRYLRLSIATLLFIFFLILLISLYQGENTDQAYTLPLASMITLWLALSTNVILRKLPTVFQWAVLILPISLFIIHLSEVSLAQDQEVENFMAQVTEIIPESALVLVDNEAETFTLWYYRFIEKRLDATIVDVSLMEFAWYRDNLKQTYHELAQDHNLDDALSLIHSWQDTIVSRDPFPPTYGCRLQKVEDWWIRDCNSS